jgi:Domain of unknown function (DUF4158)
MRIAFLVLLKTFQRFGYFLPLHKAPRQIAEHISMIYGVHYEAMEWEAYDGSGARHRHIARICDYLGVRHFDETARRILSRTIQQAAFLREDLVDIINIAIEELVRRRYELPAFRTLRDEAQRARAAINRGADMERHASVVRYDAQIEAAGITRGAAIEANRIHMMESVVRTVGSKIAKDIEGGMVLRY